MILFLPEIILLSAAFALLLGDLFDRFDENSTTFLALTATIASAASLWAVPDGSALGGRFIVDGVAWWLKLLFISGGIAAVVLSRASEEPLKKPSAEFNLILLFTIAGASFLASARDMVTLYVSLELAGLPLFLLVAWRRDALSAEAGLKFLVLGAIASSFLLYGFGLLYGLAGTTDLSIIGRTVTAGPVLWLAAGLILTGAGFKMSIAPFHVWAPDVYQGAPTPVTAYLSVFSKAIGVGVLILVFYLAFGRFMVPMSGVFAILAAITMTWGNVGAVLQTDVKRLLAYSGISQAGYILLGFIGISPENIPTTIFYMLVYLVSNAAVFAVLVICSRQNVCASVSDFRGLARKSPLVALAMMLALFSLAGIPPLSGFVGKFFLFSIAAKNGMHWLVALAALNSTVSLYYYLRIVREMYMEAPEQGARASAVHPLLRAALGVSVVAVIAFGLAPLFYHAVFSGTSLWMEAIR